LILRGFWQPDRNTIHHSSRKAPGWRNRAENAQRDRDLWPRGNTAPETTLLSGYGVDTLRWADNVRGTGSSCCPDDFQRGLTRRAREQRRVGGHLRRCSPRGLGPARLARSNSIHAVGRLIVETSWAICSFPAHTCEQGRTQSAASPLLGRHTRGLGLDWGPRGALQEPAPDLGGPSPAPLPQPGGWRPSRGRSYAPMVNDLSAGVDHVVPRPKRAEQRLTWLAKVLKRGECKIIKVYPIDYLPIKTPYTLPPGH